MFNLQLVVLNEVDLLKPSSGQLFLQCCHTQWAEGIVAAAQVTPAQNQ
jgi:hypothetical protein